VLHSEEPIVNPFPFSAEEWNEVREAARSVVNATLADDAVLQASHFEQLRLVLADLRARYGELPILLETEADFTDAPACQLELYQRAKRIAVENKLSTASIRVALARLLLEDFGQSEQALEELRACQAEIQAEADESKRREWSKLMDEASRLANDSLGP
jgi:hypothetical protein